ncbi:peptidoglycan-binding domain-containing protein [Amycolatopsis thermalba]|uniref:peptidoglycan-binding domain-containing protein n=1 Tax=Amycolatopsis thermalba TaxID=944492 RepID=UPI000E235947|nr:peptidoglycan-binding domain-containing protein [Amycolatopsis thermalba]
MTARRRAGRVVAVVAILAAAGTGFVVADPFGAPATETSIDNGSATGLGQVTKGTLSARSQQNGTLGYAGSYPAINNANGKVTRLPAVGDIVKQGDALYWVEGVAVLLLQGGYPAYRNLYWGMEGADVQQLNAALVALGYATTGELDPESDYFGRQTYYAVRELQEHTGIEETGQLTLGQIVFLPAAEIRVTQVNAALGAAAAPGGVLLTASSTQREVTVALNANKQSEVKAGDPVTITLPNGTRTDGVVAWVGKVATKDDDSTTVDVHITPSDPAATGQLDQAPVQVSIVSETVQDVLTVPVNALLALAGGGYQVEVVDVSGARRLVPVETGLFDDSAGRVEVRGDGLAEGQNVVVPA